MTQGQSVIDHNNQKRLHIEYVRSALLDLDLEQDGWHFGVEQMTDAIYLAFGDRHYIYCSPGWNFIEQNDNPNDDDTIDLNGQMMDEDGEIVLHSDLLPLMTVELSWEDTYADAKVIAQRWFQELPAIITAFHLDVTQD